MGYPTREIDVTVKTLDAKRGVVRYIASDATIDSYGELIDPAGWKFDGRWATNKPICKAHSYDPEDLLGKGIYTAVEGGKLIIDAQFAIEESPLAAFVFRMVDGGFMPACSVGFRPVRYAFSWGDPQTWQDALKYAISKFSLTPEQVGTLDGIYLEQQLSELSPCVLGANPNALAQVAKAYGEKQLSEEDFRRLAAFVPGRPVQKLSVAVQPSSESGPPPTVGDGGVSFARPADVTLLRMFENAARGAVPTRDDVARAFERLAA